MAQDDVEAYTAKVLAETREELARADNKAQILLAAFGIVIGAILAGLLSGDWKPERLDHGATELFWVGGGFSIAACATLGWALWPRITHEAADGPASYFGDVLAYKGNRAGLKK